MNWLQLSFDQPWFLLLLVLLPVIWVVGWRSLSGLNRSQFWLAIGIRSAVLIALVCAMAEIQLVRLSQRIVALFVIDQSTSVAAAERQQAFAYAGAAVAKHRDPIVHDEAGVIVFGAEAQIEHPPSEFGSLPNGLQSTLDDGRTNLAAALRLAKASFPAGAARRIVVLSDGNQNVGSALIEARDLTADGIGIDVAPLAHGAQGDIVVERVVAPAGIRAGAPFEVQVVVDYRLPPENEFSKAPPNEVQGKLSILRNASGHAHLVGEENVTLRPGKQLFQFRQQLTESAFYTYEAKFVPTDARLDHYSQNNVASAFTHLQGQGRVLLIVNSEHPTEFDGLATLLRKHELEVTIQPTNALFTSLAELQNYDCVVLGNVPRTTGVQAAEVHHFTDEQVTMLVKNVEQMGAGMVMIGGPASFGAGDWANTELEKALPVDLQVKNAKVSAVSALMLVIDKSGSMAGDKLESSKAAAVEAVHRLGPMDYVGLIAFDDGHEEVIKLQKVGDQAHRIKARIKRLGPGGGTNMESGVKRGYDQLTRSTASVKHMIILTDGQTAGSGYQRLASDMRKRNITTSTVAVGADASKSLLQEIATRGDGKYYQATNPKALPGIFTREVRRVVRPVVYESESGLTPIRQQAHEILVGIDSPPPPITGYVLTTLKENPLVEAPLLAPQPSSPNNTLLATWTYGLGRTVAFTTDSGQRWSSGWSNWSDRDKLFVQMVRWSMRPLLDQGNFTVNAQVRDGTLEVNVQALTSAGDFVNNLSMTGGVTGADNQSQAELEFAQAGPGRYVAKVPLEKSGTYLIGIQPGPGLGVLRTGVNIASSAEFRETTANESLLVSIAAMSPLGGKPGEVIRLPEDSAHWSQFAGPNIFRRDLTPGRSLTGVWPVVVLISACLFFFDVFNRRVQIPWDSLISVARYFRRKQSAESPQPAMARLQAIKRQTREQYLAHLERTPPSVEVAAADSNRESATTVVPANSSSELESQPAMDDEQNSVRLLRKMREMRDRSKKKSES
jgi:Mg-chelatase subunit ChlD